MIDIDEFRKIKKTSIIALVVDDYLFNKLILKGGTCLELAHQINNRASRDIDFSIEKELDDKVLTEIIKIIENNFIEQFAKIGYYPFDIKIKNKPKYTPENIKMSGYALSFKLIGLKIWEANKDDITFLRNRAIILGEGDKKDFIIEISKYEYVQHKVITEIDGHKIYVYPPALIICEKLRALCQKMKEYRGRDNDTDLPRARDFYDIYVVNENLEKTDFKNEENRFMLAEVFKAKDVKLDLLLKLKDKYSIHNDDFKSVIQTEVKQKELPEIFDFYFSYTLKLINDLEEFWVK